MKLSDADTDFLDGYLEHNEDLPDGAWQAACEEDIAACPRFRGRNPFEVWLAWATRNDSDAGAGEAGRGDLSHALRR